MRVRRIVKVCCLPAISAARLWPPQWSSPRTPSGIIPNGGAVTGSTALSAPGPCGETSEVVRETIQLLLLGPPGQHGTGCIPKPALIEVVSARGLADLADIIRVRHASGDTSTIALKAYGII